MLLWQLWLFQFWYEPSHVTLFNRQPLVYWPCDCQSALCCHDSLTPPSRGEQGQRTKQTGGRAALTGGGGGGGNLQLELRSRCSSWCGGAVSALHRTGMRHPRRRKWADRERNMQAEDMEVPIINNLNDNGDRLRPKGKDAFKDQQKESEVNRRGVCVQSAIV